MANGIIEIMGELNPQFRDIVDFKHKLWDHLFLISNFELDVDSPYEKPIIEKLFEKPEPLSIIPKNKIKYNHYGKVIELMIEEAIKMEDNELKSKLIVAIANQMKKSYVNWNLDTVEDEIILNQLTKLSNKKLVFLKEQNYLSLCQIQNNNMLERKRKIIEIIEINTKLNEFIYN